MTTHMHSPARSGPARSGTAAASLAAPIRNLYPYGKLLDGPHLEMEQDYHSGMRRLINRLSIGAGVLCGLRVKALEGGGVAVGPGVAIDGLGREIVVDRTVVLDDPWALSDECGRPSERRLEGGPVVLCLEHHECPTDPIPSLVVDCDVHEECVPGAVRETFRVLVRQGPAPSVGLSPEQCRTIFASGGGGTPGRDGGAAPGPGGLRVSVTHDLPRRLGRARAAAAAHAGIAATDLRARVCEAMAGPCPDAYADCVPLALVRRVDDAVEVEVCAARTSLYSNAVLLDLILCLAERVEECCGRRPPVAAPPVVRALFPAPAQIVSPAELGRPLEGKPSLVTVFDRPMTPEHLRDPGDWLRLWRIGPPTGEGRVAVVRVGLKFVEATEIGPLDNAAVYLIADETPAGSRWLIQMRAAGDGVAGGVITDTATPPLSLDADFSATGLDDRTLEAIWDTEKDVRPRDVYDRLAAGPAAALPSGDGDEGGRLAGWFEMASDDR